MKNRRKRTVDLEEGYANRAKDMAYIIAFRNGFDERYCSSKVKRFTPEEIRAFENQYLGNRPIGKD